jgi:hypothetical protein
MDKLDLFCSDWSILIEFLRTGSNLLYRSCDRGASPGVVHVQAMERQMATAIFATTARLDDEAQMARFLSPIPNGGQLAEVLGGRKPVSTRAYEDETWTARFVESDGNIVMCFTVSDITIDQAEMIEAAWEDICTLDETAFRKTVERALGVS